MRSWHRTFRSCNRTRRQSKGGNIRRLFLSLRAYLLGPPNAASFVCKCMIHVRPDR